METLHGNLRSDGNMGNGVLSCGRQMLGDGNHRNTLSTMLNLTESNTFKEFTWDGTHQTFIDFLTTERSEVLWLIPRLLLILHLNIFLFFQQRSGLTSKNGQDKHTLVFVCKCDARHPGW
jgi:hypothetical protein